MMYVRWVVDYSAHAAGGERVAELPVRVSLEVKASRIVSFVLELGNGVVGD